jgi:hypothetical protein
MPDIEEVKAEFNRLDGVDKRWVLVCAVVAVAALVSAALAGSLFGDVIAFILTFTAGWVVHAQWNVIRRPRTKASSTTRSTRSRRPARTKS